MLYSCSYICEACMKLVRESTDIVADINIRTSTRHTVSGLYIYSLLEKLQNFRQYLQRRVTSKRTKMDAIPSEKITNFRIPITNSLDTSATCKWSVMKQNTSKIPMWYKILTKID